MCPKFGTICVVVRRGRVGLDCSEPLGINDPRLSKGLSREVVPRVAFALNVVLRDDKPGASRKFLFPSIAGEIELLFPIPGPNPSIVDPRRPSRKLTLLPLRPISGAPGKAEDLRRPEPRGLRRSNKFISSSWSSVTDEALSLR